MAKAGRIVGQCVCGAIIVVLLNLSGPETLTKPAIDGSLAHQNNIVLSVASTSDVASVPTVYPYGDFRTSTG